MPSTSKTTVSSYVAVALLVCSGCYWLGKRSSNPTTTDNGLEQQASSDGFDEPSPTPARDVFPDPSPERLHKLITNRGEPHRALELKLAIEESDVVELTALWEFAVPNLNLSDDADFDIAAAIIARLAHLDPAAALALVERDGAAWKSQLNRNLVGAWAQVDLEAALEWIANAGSGVRDRALRDTLELLGDRDRGAAVAIFREQVAKGVIGKGAWGAEEFFNEWAKENPRRAIQAALEHLHFTGRDNALGGAMESWATRAPKAALAWLAANADQLTDKQHLELTGTLFASWSNTAPADAAPDLLAIENDKVFRATSNHVLRDWAAIDFDSAAEWIETVEDENRRKHLERMLIDGARNEGDRMEAVAYAAQQFESNGTLSHPMYMAVASVIDRDGDYAEKIQWVQDVAPNDHVLEEFYNTLLHQWRGDDVSEAIKHLDLMPDPVRRAEDYEFYARYWANGDLDAAREFANNMPESEDRDRALVGVSAAWAEQEPDTALEWIGTLESGDLRDRITSTYLGTQAENDIPTALELAGSLENPFRRDHSLEFVMGKWLAQDRPAAEAAIRDHPDLSETARWRLLEGGRY